MRWGMVLAVLGRWGRAWKPCCASVVVLASKL